MFAATLPRESRVTLEFRELTYKIQLNKFNPLVKTVDKIILQNVSGIFKPQLHAIMGPSGAGKTSLMNILAGYKNSHTHGSVLVNGRSRDLTQFNRMSSYIMQHDVHLPQLTIMEAMRFAAHLKLPPKLGQIKKDLVINEILKNIGLENCKDTKTSKISNGQRKRLSMALELVNNPPLMLFDEPLSGLDSSSCYSCISILKSLAQGGRTIIATIHQPSARIFELFDSLYLLSKGRNLYQGPTSNLVPFLTNHGLPCPANYNPAVFAIEIASGDYGPKLIDLLTSVTSNEASSSSFQNEVTEVNDVGLLNSIQNYRGQCSRDFHHFVILFKRSLLCVSRDMTLTHHRLASTIFIGLLIGALFKNVGNDASKCFSNAGYIFCSLFLTLLSSMMSTVVTFPLERDVFIRENLNSWYSPRAYFFARTSADLPFQFLFPLLHVLITFYMTEQPREAFRFWIVYLMTTLTGLVGQSIGLALGAVLSVQRAVFVAPVTTIPLMLFSGFLVNVNSITIYLRWISWLAYTRFAFQATLTGVYGFNRKALECSSFYCQFKHPHKFLEAMDTTNIHVGEETLYLIAFISILRIFTYWGLCFKLFVIKY